jgi:hypothetical protein
MAEGRVGEQVPALAGIGSNSEVDVVALRSDDGRASASIEIIEPGEVVKIVEIDVPEVLEIEVGPDADVLVEHEAVGVPPPGRRHEIVLEAKHLLRIRLIEVQAAIDLVLVHTALEKPEIGVSERRSDVIVVAVDSQVLAVIEKICQAAESLFCGPVDGRVRAEPMAVPDIAIAVPRML